MLTYQDQWDLSLIGDPELDITPLTLARIGHWQTEAHLLMTIYGEE